jgi:CheY-like chemotaxis protein
VALTAACGPLRGHLEGDPKRLRQVVENLVSNAIKFTPAGGRVHVETSGDDASVTLSVRDTGEGIAPEFLPYVFDRFRQADASVTRKHGGLGLGLAIVKHIVDLHGGAIHVASPGVGQGADFSVTLPLASLPSQAHPVPGALAAASLAGVRALVVDDELDGRQMIRRVLEEREATVVAVGSGPEALASLAGGVPHVVVCDVGMPGMDGYELVGRLRAELGAAGRGVLMVALTAYARPEDRARALAAGFDAHLTKPIEPATLATTVGALLRRNLGPAATADEGLLAAG